jgi:beta-galactosidase
MRTITTFNEGWVFHAAFSVEQTTAFQPGETVALPHTAVETPYAYFDETAYQHPFGYQKELAWDDAFEGQEVALVFDGAMANAVVYLNGQEIAAHADGYTPFEARLTGLLKPGANLIAVKIDGAENPAIPPFGGQIDYLTYAGLYRDVWLKVTPKLAIRNVKIETPDALAASKTVTVRADLADAQSAGFSGTITATLKDAAGKVMATASAPVAGPSVQLAMTGLTGLSLWDLDTPVLYTVAVELTSAHGTDTTDAAFGFRTAEFSADGFLLNGKPLKIRGLNRHQSFPYVGYAMGRRAQERDAEILKKTLKLNLVRTSHYPQSTWFLDACDRLGLLVFEEIPGWQHIGGDVWKARAVDNVRAMIERDWNHPSIVLWGVRINESQDDHDFYTETNRLAHELDPARQTGGVRYITDSELLEDVYTMNDFILGNEELPNINRPRTATRDQKEVTGLTRNVPYMITEFNGHMHPTKRYDQEQRQAQHVTRYLEILDSVYGDPHKAGCIGWCMFDYNTHKDFGSGDRICHHGVMDMFREPKFAAYVYTSQCDPVDEVVMKPVTYWARGERNIGGVLPLIVLTNCDEVELSYGPSLKKRVGPDREKYPNLPHAPVVFDHRHFSPDELGLWGMRWEDGTLTGYVGGKPVATLRMVADPLPTTLRVVADDTVLAATAKDTTRVIVRALDQAGNLLPFLDDPVSVDVVGPAKAVGPRVTTLRGGTAGFWLETTGGAGNIAVTVTSPRFAPVVLSLKTR